MAVKKLVKRFDFVPENYSRFDLTGGLRLNVDAPALEVPRVTPSPDFAVLPPEYDLSQSLTAQTWIANPEAVKQWLGFAVENPRPPKHPDPNAGVPVYVAQYRLHDGTNEMYWDGGAWSIATLDAHWNTEGEIATNISTFPVTSRQLGVVVNLWTVHKAVTPKLRAFKVLYEADIVESYDLIYNSLVPELKSAFASRSRVAYAMPSTSTEVDLSDLEALGFDTAYDLSDVVAAYDYTNDPNRLVDLLSSFDTGTKLLTLSSSVAEDDLLWIEFEYGSTVAVQTSRDYHEISSIPSVEVVDIQQLEKVEHTTIEDGVLNVDTGDGWKIPGPRVADVTFDIEMIADKQSDLHNMMDAVRSWISSSPLLRMRGTDEEFQMQITAGPTVTSSPNDTNLRMAKMSVVILNVPFFERPAVTAKKLGSIAFSGGNLPLTIT